MNIINEVETAEKIFYNPLLLENIFKFSTCQEQLKLCRVCPDFQDVIVKRIWKRRHKNLQILEFMSKYLIVGGNVVPNETLNVSEYKEFLHLGGDNIKTLQINMFSLFNNCSIIFTLNVRLMNLTHLSLRNVKLTESDIKSVPESFPNLKHFTIKSCFRCNGAAIHTLNDFDKNLFEKLPKLEEFKIKFTFQNVYLRKGSV